MDHDALNQRQISSPKAESLSKPTPESVDIEGFASRVSIQAAQALWQMLEAEELLCKAACMSMSCCMYCKHDDDDNDDDGSSFHG